MALPNLGESHPTGPEIPPFGKSFGYDFWVYVHQLRVSTHHFHPLFGCKIFSCLLLFFNVEMSHVGELCQVKCHGGEVLPTYEVLCRFHKSWSPMLL